MLQVSGRNPAKEQLPEATWQATVSECLRIPTGLLPRSVHAAVLRTATELFRSQPRNVQVRSGSIREYADCPLCGYYGVDVFVRISEPSAEIYFQTGLADGCRHINTDIPLTKLHVVVGYNPPDTLFGSVMREAQVMMLLNDVWLRLFHELRRPVPGHDETGLSAGLQAAG